MATIKGTNYSNTLNGTSYADYIYGYGGNDTLNGNGGNDHLYGGDGSDHLNGGSGTDYLYGDAGNDYLNGGSGIDWMYGGTGNDVFYPSTFSDHFDGGSGTDTISFQKYTSGVSVQLNNGQSNDAQDSWAAAGGSQTGIEKVLGSQYADSLFASVPVGATANYTLDGAGGNDFLLGEALDDKSIKMYGGAGNDYIAWTGQGGAGHTIAYGGGGNDRLDTHDMTGGTGADTFVLEAFDDPMGNNNGAIVHDFHHSEGDQILFSVEHPSTLTHSGDIWTVHNVDGDFSFEIANVTSLSSSDYHFG